MKTYKIVRHYADGREQKIIDQGLSLEEAQEHCQSEETHEVDEDGNVVWFDGYTEE